MSSATEELRRLLDERGVEWEAPMSFDGTARYDTTAGGYWFHELNGKITIHGLTPEQAIDATLGRETCEYCKDGRFDGQTVMISNHGWQHINFCPNCGRKVVDE